MRYEINLQTGETTEHPDDAATPAPRNVQGEIDMLERATLLPRVAREFMLIQFAAVAASQGVDPTTNAGYVKLKALDDQIAVLRAIR